MISDLSSWDDTNILILRAGFSPVCRVLGILEQWVSKAKRKTSKPYDESDFPNIPLFQHSNIPPVRVLWQS